MRLIAAGLIALAVAGCQEPDKRNRTVVFVKELQDVSSWDPKTGGASHDIVQYLLSLPPEESVPALLTGLMDPTPTRIDDRIHRIPSIGDVCFHLLLTLFKMTPADFDAEGVWVGNDPINNPIYNVHLDNDGVRLKCRARFQAVAEQRGWMEPEKPR